MSLAGEVVLNANNEDPELKTLGDEVMILETSDIIVSEIAYARKKLQRIMNSLKDFNVDQSNQLKSKLISVGDLVSAGVQKLGENLIKINKDVTLVKDEVTTMTKINKLRDSLGSNKIILTVNTVVWFICFFLNFVIMSNTTEDGVRGNNEINDNLVIVLTSFAILWVLVMITVNVIIHLIGSYDEREKVIHSKVQVSLWSIVIVSWSDSAFNFVMFDYVESIKLRFETCYFILMKCFLVAPTCFLNLGVTIKTLDYRVAIVSLVVVMPDLVSTGMLWFRTQENLYNKSCGLRLEPCWVYNHFKVVNDSSVIILN